jgi:tight adherence protein B
VLAVLVLAGAAAATVLGGPLLLAGAVVAAAVAPVVARRRARTDVRRRRRTQLPGALERLATALRAGSSVPTALGAVGGGLPAPIGPELAELGRQAEGGRAVAEVLDEWAARHDDAGTRLAASALVLATVVGGAPGRAVDGVAATLRERLDLSDERRALGSQARMSTLVLSVAPLGFALLLGATDGASSRFLLGTPAGWACLVVGLGLDAAGAWWMARLTRGGEP